METSDAPQIVEHLSLSIPMTPFDVCWIKNTKRFTMVGETPKAVGVLRVYELKRQQLKEIISTEASTSIKCNSFFKNINAVSTGDYGGTVSLWDLNKIETPFWSSKAHTAIINAVDTCGGGQYISGPPEIVTGSRDGKVKISDPRVESPVLSFEPKSGDGADCWSVAFGGNIDDKNRLVAAGYDNGDVKLFDLRTATVKWETNVNNGVCCVQFDRQDIVMNKMAVTTLSGKLLMYDMRTQHPQTGFAFLTEGCANATIWGCQFLPQNREICAVKSGSGSLSIYKYHYPSHRSVEDADGVKKGVIGSVDILNEKTISTQPIIGFDWHTDKTGLCAMACLDQSIKVAFVTKLHLF